MYTKRLKISKVEGNVTGFVLNKNHGGWVRMIGPVKDFPSHPRSLLKRKHPGDSAPVAKRAAPAPSLPEVVDISDVCSYETISDYIQLFGDEEVGAESQGSPASLESGYHTSGPQDADDEDSNLSWLLNFKVSSLFDAPEDKPPPKKDDSCKCSCALYQKPAGKPPYTYTELIEKALKEQGELTVSGIYSWISAKYPYYSPSDDRWKNSVRHNLSINPHFRKGIKSRHGAGHLWTLSNEGVSPPPESWKRHSQAEEVDRKPPEVECMDEAAIAAASIMEPVETDETGTPLTRVAEEILSGVKRRVEVQYLVNDHNTNGIKSDPDRAFVVLPPSWSSLLYSPEFLNPVSKEEIVSESGLDTEHCDATSSLLSDLNTELHLPDNLFSDELAFSCYSQL
ncbi:forkhead box protein N2-like [Macrosteles quadrilineatus]|uniref:forkhead box protein N2-like n=1 Tax=Macrosteles quadrilineatus TaxID=74068 RepID=UPI0023E10BA2|nr:forkhead box protein N2-like [Macrosteles quadrilineatus]